MSDSMEPLELEDLKAKMKRTTRMMEECREEMEKNIRNSAVLYRIAYDALTAEGFSNDQAIELIKARGATLP